MNFQFRKQENITQSFMSIEGAALAQTCVLSIKSITVWFICLMAYPLLMGY